MHSPSGKRCPKNIENMSLLKFPDPGNFFWYFWTPWYLYLLRHGSYFLWVRHLVNVSLSQNFPLSLQEMHSLKTFVSCPGNCEYLVHPATNPSFCWHFGYSMSLISCYISGAYYCAKQSPRPGPHDYFKTSHLRGSSKSSRKRHGPRFNLPSCSLRQVSLGITHKQLKKVDIPTGYWQIWKELYKYYHLAKFVAQWVFVLFLHTRVTYDTVSP